MCGVILATNTALCRSCYLPKHEQVKYGNIKVSTVARPEISLQLHTIGLCLALSRALFPLSKLNQLFCVLFVLFVFIFTYPHLNVVSYQIVCCIVMVTLNILMYR